jgi:RNA polymerase sigma-70 factor (ECF subfamily)
MGLAGYAAGPTLRTSPVAWGSRTILSAVVTDSDVWDALRTGEADALAVLFDRHSKAVYNFAFRRSTSWSVAEEVLQATFTTVWKRAAEGRLDPLTRPTALPYLVTVAGYECANLIRSTSRWTAAFRRSEAQLEEPDHADAVVANVEDERRMRAVHQAMKRLPRGQREALELVVWSELSMADAAAVLGVAEGTVKSRVSRARASLHGLITHELGEEGLS